ncbi:MAG: exonuclease domain-containing protein [Candidatus Omnitrophota bacterium]|nr:exonuclease domain-containing protein [Candidatus Omnitrophota bacterium]
MNQHINDVEFVIFDTETTGLEPQSGDRVIEIAALRLKGQDVLSTFETLVDPLRPVSVAAFRVNGISDEMLKTAPKFDEVIPRFLKFIEGACLCSYNAGFDMGFLNNELRLAGSEALQNIAVVDVLKMSRRLLPELERHALWFVAQKLGIQGKQAHRAFSDVEMTLGVFNKLREILESKGAIDFVSFNALFGLNSGFIRDVHNQKIAEIQRAIDQKLTVKIKYLSSSGAEISERQVIPGQIRQEYNHSYLVGYCCLKKEERTFRIDGILHLEVV